MFTRYYEISETQEPNETIANQAIQRKRKEPIMTDDERAKLAAIFKKMDELIEQAEKEASVNRIIRHAVREIRDASAHMLADDARA